MKRVEYLQCISKNRKFGQSDILPSMTETSGKDENR